MKGWLRSAKSQLILATDTPPLGPQSDRFPLGRAHAALMHTVASRHGAWVAAGEDIKLESNSWLKPVVVDAEMLAAHRSGYCATTLAGVHFGHSLMPEQRPEWLQAHQEVSAQYARTIASLAAPDALVWLHDHHLQLAVAPLRQLRPDVHIGVTMHSPFPHPESFLALAEREDILASLRSADLITFPENRSLTNFQTLMDEPQLAPVDNRAAKAIVMPMPAESSAIAHLAGEPKVQTSAARIRASLRPATTIFLSMGGNDPADGSAQALQEFATLLSARKLDSKRVAYIQLAPTTPFPGADANAQRQELERLVAKINGEFASPGYCPVHYQRRDITAAELTALYLAADVLVATPLRDRATPQAAEYAAARADGRGHIIISEFSSTLHQLEHVKPVNPHEPAALGDAMVAAVHKAKRRSASMFATHERVTADGVSTWAQDFLSLLAGNCAQQLAHRIVEGSIDSAQRSDFSSRLTATASHS